MVGKTKTACAEAPRLSPCVLRETGTVRRWQKETEVCVIWDTGTRTKAEVKDDLGIFSVTY